MLLRPRFRRPLVLWPALVLGLSWLSMLPAHAQDGGTTVRVVVRAAATGAPVAGALVSAAGRGLQGTTNARGVVRLVGLATGEQWIRARYLGYATTTERVFVSAGEPAEVRLDLQVQPIRLAEVRVRARRSILQINGFEDRRRSGFGTFITREQIARMQPRLLSDVLRRAGGMQLTPSGTGGMARASSRGNRVVTGSCPIQYYVDGTMTMSFEVDNIPPRDVEGLEIYKGAASIPAAYNKGSALCGVILIWTRID